MNTLTGPVDSLASTLEMTSESPLAGQGEDPLVGRVLGSKYKILSPIGRGSVGTVYRALRNLIFDEVAIKVLHPQYAKDSVIVERFHREACAAAQLHDPRIVKIYDYADMRDEGLVFLVMELIRGITLRSLLQTEGSLPIRRAVELMIEICGGVEVAHRQGIIHRDLKPDNIMLAATEESARREAVVVFDFGVCKLTNDTLLQVLTQPGMIVGTPYYMAPEQCRGQRPDQRVDVYSLGATLYEMIAGKPPFEGETPLDILVKQVYEDPEPLTTRCGTSAELNSVVMRALSKDPRSRQANATEFAQDLRRCRRLVSKSWKYHWGSTMKSLLMTYL